MMAFTTTQLASLTTLQLTALGTEDLNALSSTQFAAFSTSQFSALTTDQISHLSTAQFAALGTADIAALTTAQAHALSTAEIMAFTTTQIAALSTADIAAFTTAQVAAFESADIQAMSDTQVAALISATPIVLDLDGSGIQTVSAAHGVSFDVTGTGHTVQTGWVGGHDGLLVMDRNHDGVVNDGRELFGVGTRLASGLRAGDGYAALAEMDTNHDGKITAADAHFKDLKVWVDANHDGKTDLGELKGLAELGITELSLAHAKGNATDNGNLLGLVGSYTTANGSQHQMADVWFTKQTGSEAAAASHADQAPPKLSELLAAPGDAVQHAEAASAPVASPAAHADAAPPPVAVHQRLTEDDPQHRMPLI
jgi:hypothetical protein